MSKFNAAMLEAGMIPGDLGAFKKEAGKLKLYFGGGGGGGNTSTQSTGTTYTTNIPEYARPYVENMLGATQEQLFTSDGQGTLTGFRPYAPYSTNMQDYIAPFSPLQTQAQTTAASMRMPAQFGAATGLTGAGGIGTGQTAGQLQDFGTMAQRQMTSPGMQAQYMNPFIQNALQPTLQEMQRQYGITGQQERAKAVAAGAFGGTRDALMQAENQRNKNIAMNQAIGTGYQQAFQTGQAAQQAALNMGLQGLTGAQAGYGQMGQLGGQLGQLGTAQLGAEQGIIGTQAQQGALQQAAQQAMINQAIQNYATAQQYPLMQLGFMSNMLRGLPMQSTSTQQYVASPSAFQQSIGAAGTGASLYNAMKAKGGIVDSRKSGGIVGYDVGGKVESILDDMSPDQLKDELQKSSSQSVKKMAARLLAEKKMAGGGIVAFAQGNQDGETVGDAVKEEEPTRQSIVDFAPEPKQEPKPAAAGIVQASPEQQVLQKAIGQSNAPPELKAMYGLVGKDIGQTLEQRLQEKKDVRDRLIGPDVATQEYRSKLMAERANAEDEASRNRYMRMAEFFAKWGSTPGPMLAAGLNAAKDSVGNLIKDKESQKKYQQGLDEAIYKLDKAKRLEDMGLMDKAADEVEASKKLAQPIMQSMTQVWEAQKRAETAAATAGSKSDEKEGKAIARAEKQYEQDPEVKRITGEMKYKEEKGMLTPEDRRFYNQELAKYRAWHYQNNKVEMPSAQVERGLSPSDAENRRAELEQKIKDAKPWFGKPSEAQQKIINDAQRELDKLNGVKPTPVPQEDKGNRPPLESYDKKDAK